MSLASQQMIRCWQKLGGGVKYITFVCVFTKYHVKNIPYCKMFMKFRTHIKPQVVQKSRHRALGDLVRTRPRH